MIRILIMIKEVISMVIIWTASSRGRVMSSMVLLLLMMMLLLLMMMMIRVKSRGIIINIGQVRSRVRGSLVE